MYKQVSNLKIKMRKPFPKMRTNVHEQTHTYIYIYSIHRSHPPQMRGATLLMSMMMMVMMMMMMMIMMIMIMMILIDDYHDHDLI